MFSIYDSECPVCRTIKKVKVKSNKNHPQLELIEHIKTEHWGYACLDNEVIVEAFCPGCGIKFIVG